LDESWWIFDVKNVIVWKMFLREEVTEIKIKSEGRNRKQEILRNWEWKEGLKGGFWEWEQK